MMMMKMRASTLAAIFLVFLPCVFTMAGAKQLLRHDGSDGTVDAFDPSSKEDQVQDIHLGKDNAINTRSRRMSAPEESTKLRACVNCVHPCQIGDGKCLDECMESPYTDCDNLSPIECNIMCLFLCNFDIENPSPESKTCVKTCKGGCPGNTKEHSTKATATNENANHACGKCLTECFKHEDPGKCAAGCSEFDCGDTQADDKCKHLCDALCKDNESFSECSSDCITTCEADKSGTKF
mmetsp:Transcript_17434/g.26673  ORF Transcript_17434/g.26673 Transcript_17434/m.26673 type:complete len:238 (+) Transcript_17434:166-879(+)